MQGQDKGKDGFVRGWRTAVGMTVKGHGAACSYGASVRALLFVRAEAVTHGGRGGVQQEQLRRLRLRTWPYLARKVGLST